MATLSQNFQLQVIVKDENKIGSKGLNKVLKGDTISCVPAHKHHMCEGISRVLDC